VWFEKQDQMGMTQAGMTSVQLHETYAAPYKERIAELEAALKPFAVMAGSYTNESGAHVPLSKAGAIISVYDLRRAEDALTKSTL
jgi:hypothetical protein